MAIILSPLQCRVIGVLLEKEITTPDQYPLSLNAITSGCNQKSSREPVLNLSEFETQDIIDELSKSRLISEQSGSSRVAKYLHRFCNTQFSELHLNKQQLAIICLLLLRGPQTPGELRTRSNRLADFASVNEVEECLQQLTALDGKELVIKYPREPGKRDCRWGHLFHNAEQQAFVDEQQSSNHNLSVAGLETPALSSDQDNRIVALEDKVAELSEQVELLTQLIDELTS